MKLDEMMNIKTLLAIGAILLSIGIATSVDFSGLRPGAIVPQAVTIQNINNVDYAIVAIDGHVFDDSDIGFVKTSDEAHYNVDGNVDGNVIEGDFDAVIKIKVLNTGWSMQLKPYNTDPFVNEIWAEKCGVFDLFTCTETEAGDPLTYYQVSTDMRPLAEYEVWAVVNGVEQPHALVTPSNTDQTIILPGTDPKIYWKENSYGLDGLSTVPIGAAGYDIIKKDDTGNIVFVEKNHVEIAALYWNAILLRDYNSLMYNINNGNWKASTGGVVYTSPEEIGLETKDLGLRIDFNNDEVFDVTTSAPHKTFTPGNLNHNTYQYLTCDGLGCGDKEGFWLDFPSLDREPYVTAKDPKGYLISGDELLREGRLTISGTFQIPLEYGDVRIVTREPLPEIVSLSESFEVFSGGFKEITVTVKNNGESGVVPVIPEMGDTNVGSLILPEAQKKLIPAGETEDFVFRFDSNAAGIGVVIFYANAGVTQDSITIDFEVKAPPADAVYHNIKIIAINKATGAELESIYPGKFPLTVDQNAVTKYGIWEGQLWEGSPTVSGQTVVVDGTTWYPEDPKTLTITEDETFTFKYSTEEDDEDGISFIWYIIGGVVIGLLILGGYIYKTEYMNN